MAAVDQEVRALLRTRIVQTPLPDGLQITIPSELHPQLLELLRMGFVCGIVLMLASFPLLAEIPLEGPENEIVRGVVNFGVAGLVGGIVLAGTWPAGSVIWMTGSTVSIVFRTVGGWRWTVRHPRGDIRVIGAYRTDLCIFGTRGLRVVKLKRKERDVARIARLLRKGLEVPEELAPGPGTLRVRVRFQDDAGNGTVRVAPGELIVQELYAPYARFIFRASGPPLFGWRAVTLGKPIRLCPLEISTYTNEEGEMFVRLSPLGGRFPLTITHPDSATLVALVQTFCAPAEPPANPA